MSRARSARRPAVPNRRRLAWLRSHGSTDPQELTATALKSDYKDVALAAVERITDPQALRSVAARAKNPAAQRRARALLRGLEEQGAAAAEAESEAARGRRGAPQGAA